MVFRSSDSLDDEPIISFDPATTRGRWCQFLGLAVIPLVPCVGLIIYASVNISSVVGDYNAVRAVRDAIGVSTAGLDVISALHDEMDGTASYIASDGKEIIDTTSEIQRRSNLRLASFGYWSEMGISHDEFIAGLNAQRQYQNNVSAAMQIVGVLKYYEGSTSAIYEWMIKKLDQDIQISVLLDFFCYYNLLQCARHMAIVRTLGVVAFLGGNMTDAEQQWFASSADASIENLQLTIQYHNVNENLTEIGLKTSFASEFGLYDTVTGFINPKKPDLYKAVVWYRRLSQYYSGLIEIIRAEGVIIQVGISQTITSDLQNIIIYGIILACLCLVITPFIIQAARHSVISLYSYSRTMDKKAIEIKRERRKTETVLNEMLPRVISYRLRQGEKIPAEYYESVTVFFSDIEDFGDISLTSSPIDIVMFLNDIYNHMDKMMEPYDTYKVETIGCVYMVVSGLPSRNGKRHASEIARMSLDLMASTLKFIIPHLPDNTLQMRIGVHTGPVVAGVVGNKMPRYCLFGDTVNTASRLQTNGLPRHIHISRSTKDVLDAIGGFVSEERGIIAMKGKRTMMTYWLKSRMKRLSRDLSSSTSSMGESDHDCNGTTSISPILA